MGKRLRIAVVGYGSGGQAAALLLSRDGHAVEVFERVPHPGPVGAGFLLQPIGLHVLWELGLLDAVLAHGRPIARLFGETAAGRAVMDMRYAELDRRLFGLGLQRGALFQLLDGLGYVGAANLDVMYDHHDSTSKVLEINLRQGASSYYTMAAGGNLIRCVVDDLVYGKELTTVVTTAERLWVNVPYPVVLAFTPRSMRARVRAVARNGVWHTLRYRKDRGLARLVDVARIDLRHTLDYLKYAGRRLNR